MTFTHRIMASTCGMAIAALTLASSDPKAPRALRLTTPVEAAQMAESALWLAPSADSTKPSELARAIEMLNTGRAAEAASVFARSTADPLLGGYARLYYGRAQLALNRLPDAAAAARSVLGVSPGGYVGEAALWLLADSSELLGQWADAFTALKALTDIRSTNPSLAWLRLARAAEKTGASSPARAAYVKVYYEYPLTSEADAAGSALSRLPASEGPERLRLELGRAQQLYAARRYADARKAYSDVRSATGGDDRAIADLRIAECDYALQRFEVAREALRPLAEKNGPHRVEAAFYYVSTLRGLKRSDEYPGRVAEFVAANPGHPLAEMALNDLATAYILSNDDASAAQVFTQMYGLFPFGAFADRAAWKAGWWAYRNGRYAETVRLFEAAAVNQRRADYRPSWLYWAARAHEQLGEPEAALKWYRQTIADYRNSYYGRRAAESVERIVTRGNRALAVTRATSTQPVRLALEPGAPPENTRLIQRLLSVGLYTDAIFELRKTQRDVGTSPLIEATIAYALNRMGELRPAITAMRRAYPQFMAEGGEALPSAILSVIFPVQHFDLLRRYATERHLDPYLLVAQVAQESTFQADVRSVANAYGLMQILPSTGQRYASKVGVRGFSTARLKDPEVNVRIGTAYMADLLARFGDPAPALAAYNAGENRVTRWRAERPGVARDEFIDDIPFPETQNYVKRILGTAEDYRLLYGERRPAGRDLVR
ncbi:MAG: transglycosylase SLT domain-containing protein [Vicinamibacterales bacterium]